MSKLDLLKERRVAIGKAPLKSWKGSAAKLDEAIALLSYVIVPKKEAKPAPTPKPLPRIARSLGINPKAARAALRKSHGAAWKSLTEDELRAALTPA